MDELDNAIFSVSDYSLNTEMNPLELNNKKHFAFCNLLTVFINRGLSSLLIALLP